MTGWIRDFIHDASLPDSYPSDFLSISPVAGMKAQAFIERACTSSPAKVVHCSSEAPSMNVAWPLAVWTPLLSA